MVDSQRTRERIGTVLAGKYRLDRELGRGGMGAVYRAFHLRVHKEFAVKLLLAEVADHKSIAQRFFLEAQAAGRIGHPGILDVYDVGEDDAGVPFIVMELLRGEPLAALLRRKRLDPETACWIAVQVLEILAAAHKAGVVHRDVKPQNVFLCEAPNEARTVKLLDFGIAKFAANPDTSAITRSGEIIGSPLYMAPEQAKGELDVDARVDVWSVGAMLFEMLTGKAAHAAPTPVAVLAKILTEPAPPPSGQDEAIPAELDVVVQRALAIDRTTRFTSAKEMLDALQEVRTNLGWKDTPPVFGPVVRGPDDDEARGATGAVTSTIEAPSKPTGPAPPSSNEPSLEAAVTNGRKAPKQKPWAMLAVVVLGTAVLVPFMMSGFGKKEAPPTLAPASSPTAAESPLPSITASETRPAPVVSASASATPSAPTSPVAPPATTTLAPRCKAGEVLSSGHCCPRGLEWQAGVGRCERPLATSF